MAVQPFWRGNWQIPRNHLCAVMGSSNTEVCKKLHVLVLSAALTIYHCCKEIMAPYLRQNLAVLFVRRLGLRPQAQLLASDLRLRGQYATLRLASAFRFFD
jgi:hypothetical protein